MGDYCKPCFYDPKKRVGEKACPFNSLYWNFLEKNQVLRKNRRIQFSYSSWDRYSDSEKSEIVEQAQIYLTNIDSL